MHKNEHQTDVNVFVFENVFFFIGKFSFIFLLNYQVLDSDRTVTNFKCTHNY